MGTTEWGYSFTSLWCYTDLWRQQFLPVLGHLQVWLLVGLYPTAGRHKLDPTPTLPNTLHLTTLHTNSASKLRRVGLLDRLDHSNVGILSSSSFYTHITCTRLREIIRKLLPLAVPHKNAQLPFTCHKCKTTGNVTKTLRVITPINVRRIIKIYTTNWNVSIFAVSRFCLPIRWKRPSSVL